MLARPSRAGLIGAAALALLTAGCARTSDALVSVADGNSGTYKGTELSPPMPLGAAAPVALTADDGSPKTLADLQDGHLMLVFFGYTHCPDECPTAMADLGQALRTSPPQVQRVTRVVFVSSDPERDTAPVLHKYLATFDHDLPTPFVGLTGPLPKIDEAAHALGIPLAPPEKNADGTVTVEHGAELLAFSGEKASVVWLTGTSVADYRHDLKILTKDML